MAIVIGLDFGNFNSYPSFIEDLNADRNRLGGKEVDLLQASDLAGIPSVFFFDGKGGFLVGRPATTGTAKPIRNRVRYLKRSLGKPLEINGSPVVINGKQWLYDDAIREVVQCVLREANRILNQRTLTTTNLVSLAYPATYSSAERERLIKIVESATMEDGTHFRVFGTIMEPAAAALDYLAQNKRTENTTVLVFDLGGGTFDLSLVTCYPNGKRRQDGSTAYYDIHISDGLPNTGGREFDEVIYELLRGKLEKILAEHHQPMKHIFDENLHQIAEQVKKELTDSEKTIHEEYIHSLDDSVYLELTRAEFENAPRVQAMLKQMTDKVQDLLKETNLPKPHTIVLTGGSCRMPMVRAALAKALPEYAKNLHGIREYKPETAISYGAARYGVPEPAPRDPIPGSEKPVGEKSVIKRVAYEIGVRYQSSKEDLIGYIHPFMKSGKELPYTSEWVNGYLLYESDRATYRLYESNKRDPDVKKPDSDYRYIQVVQVNYGRIMPEKTVSQIRLVVDKDGLVRMEARKDPNSQLYTASAQIQTQTQ